ncbi:MAG TPA: LON peptidase substrate-binding domain-containing protein [Chloroflexia bacterium]|nr:LON peptidase substrate-binding domain-containing protein [Chloroflexia bacterium]
MRLNDVPLFPLNTVLFPQMILPLHIFEQRYRAMINECLKNDTPFGVLLINEGDEVEEGHESALTARPYQVGTLARITEVTKVPDGRMLIMTVGAERFRLLEYRNDKTYMTGDIETWPDEVPSASEIELEASAVREAFEEYLTILMELAGKEIQGLEIPDEPSTLSYLIPNWLHISLKDKQRLLEAPDSLARLQIELQILKGETAFFEQIKSQANAELGQESESTELEETGPLSSNFPIPGYNISSRFSKN